MNFKLLRSLSAPGIQKSLGTSSCEFKSWIAQGKYKVTSVSQQGDIELYVTDQDALLESLGYDFSRFACASFESMEGIVGSNAFPKATAWAGIAAYYSAFFGAHAILRYFGSSCSQIEQAQACLLTDYASIYKINKRIQVGFYAAEYFPSTRMLKLKKLNDTHKDTWQKLNEVLKDLSSKILQVPGISQETQEISNLLINMSDAISNSGRFASGNWLSSFRNNLNYKHKYEAWYPYKKSSVKFKQIKKYVGDWSSDAFNPELGLLEKDERLRFFGTCSAIVYLAHGIAKDLAIMADRRSVHRNKTERFSKLTEAGRAKS